MRLGLLAGEMSGDILGAAVVAALSERVHELELTGIGGPRLTALGLESLYPMDRLSVMGLIDPLKRLPELLAIRRGVYRQQIAWQPDVFLGIDSPDFNLTLERRLRARGLRTAHLVSPSVWAWRAGRLKGIGKAIDLMMCLLPFEVAIYEKAGIPAVCVGHPLIEELQDLPSSVDMRQQLGLPRDGRLVAVLPGSRAGEVASLMPVFAQTVAELSRLDATLKFVIPAANSARAQQIQRFLADRPSPLPVTVLEGMGRQAMHAADVVLLASGTATLEAMLLRKPMVIAYRMAALSWHVLSRLATTPFAGLPNILAGREVVPELLQDNANVASLVPAMIDCLEHGAAIQVSQFDELAEAIGGGFGERCADALAGLKAR